MIMNRTAFMCFLQPILLWTALLPALGELTSAQQRILRAPARNVAQRKFSFDDAPSLQFSNEQKQTQREAGKAIAPMVAKACGSGADSVRIPPGDYRFGKETWGKDGPIYALEFSGLQRDSTHPFTIDATGATFWFDLGDDQAPKAHFCLGFRNCSNIIFKGATLDRDPRGNIEGRIMQIDFANNRIEIRLSAGITLPAKFNDNTEQRLLPFKADGTFCAPLYALQSGGVHLKYKSVTAGADSGCHWVAMADSALLDTIRDPDWIKAYGEQSILRVGDGLSCVYSTAQAVSLKNCRSMTIQDISVHIAKGGANETGGFGGHLWKNCYFGPRPKTNQWQGGDGLMLNGTRHGTALDNVTITHATDDPANIHGYWGIIKSVEGNRVAFSRNAALGCAIPSDAVAGDRLLFFARDTGATLGGAIITAVSSESVELDRPTFAFAKAIAEWLDHECAGWTIQNCDWSDNYQRLLIQSGPGVVRNCVFTRMGSAIELNSVFPTVEGGIPRDIMIADNVFNDVNPIPRGATISVYFRTDQRAEAAPLSSIAIINNTFNHPGEAAIALSNVTSGVISGNRINNPIQYTALAKPGKPSRRQAIYLSRCTKISLFENTVRDPGNYAIPDAITGSKDVGLDSKCVGILINGIKFGTNE